LHLTPAPRYSEDIDLVQKRAGPIGPTIDRLRQRLDSWLGLPKRAFKHGRVTLVYRFLSEDPEPLPLRLKVEINSREHFTVLGSETRKLEVASRWFSGSSTVSTYPLDELLGTKLRALYQRKKGRDLFDLWWASEQVEISLDRVVRCFDEYLGSDGLRVSRAELEANLESKLKDRRFIADLQPLLAPGIEWDLRTATEWLFEEITPRLRGAPWKGREEP
jgi:predicted nucleotidyltransferase component of viral defense system